MQPTIMTFRGTYFDYTNPRGCNIHIEDIAHGLSNVCRFAGHTPRFYSVAQHCVMASRLVPPEHALQTLLHDASEAFMGDVPTPLKMLLPEYKAIEREVQAAIYEQFGLPAKDHPEVKCADLQMLRLEKHYLMRQDGGKVPWAILEGVELPNIVLDNCWVPQIAKMAFLARYDQITAPRDSRG